MKKVLTLCIVHEGERVLLGMKKRGFGADRWNGFGGKVMPGESIEEAARRETHEEAMIELLNLEKVGVLTFSFEGSPEPLEVHLFKARTFRGLPTETEEMRPAWFAQSEIPFDTMWPDDRYWMPLFLADKKFEGRFHFSGSDDILEHELHETASL